jgi:hypothetical protein
MLLSKLHALVLIVVASLAVLTCATADMFSGDKHFNSVIDAALDESSGGPPRTLDVLHELKTQSENRDTALIALLDYYLGAAASAELEEFLTERGKQAKPLLEKKRNSSLECLPGYEKICVKSRDDRDRRINRMLDAIDKGKILRVQ